MVHFLAKFPRYKNEYSNVLILSRRIQVEYAALSRNFSSGEKDPWPERQFLRFHKAPSRGCNISLVRFPSIYQLTFESTLRLYERKKIEAGQKHATL